MTSCAYSQSEKPGRENATEDVPAVGAIPKVVAVGKGSYASFPPPEVDKQSRATLEKQLYLTPDALNKPIPTNQWWTNLLVDRYAGQLWAFPHQVSANKDGLDIAFPTRWNDSGSDPVSEHPLRIGGQDFAPEDARAKTWSDWLLTFRLGESANKYLDVTLGRGLPYVWIEPKGVVPTFRVEGDASFFSPDGGDVALPSTSSAIGLTMGGRSYGLFAPTGTVFSRQGDLVSAEFPAGKQFLVICPLTAKTDLATFQKYAYAIPRSSRMTWTYSPEKAEVETQWHLDTQVLQGTEKRLIQGWLPHHYRGTQNNLTFNSLSYLTPRGTMKCAVGTDFSIAYPFRGFPPMSPPPRKVGLPHDYDETRMRDYLARHATRDKVADDTYWSGKSLTTAAQYVFIANQLKDPSEQKLRDNLKAALTDWLTDWLTYAPGEKAHFFARYPNWKALIGFNTSYGSEAFNDQHFHLGYFTSSGAMLGFLDPQWLKDYGPMLRLLAKQYANWEREDPNYPYLRCFDIWEGHSWAAGLSSPTGNNQESSSEAMQGWSGLYLLGTALNDPKMQAAGAMGYAMEARAVQEYWFNQNGGNWSPSWKHDVLGMVWSGGNNYGTYFSGDPAWIWAIQWIPMSPDLSYLAEDPAFAKKSFGQMWAARKASKEGEIDLNKLGTGLGNVVLSQAAQVNPDWTAEQLDALWESDSPVAHDNDTPGLSYFFAHSNRYLGKIATDYRLSSGLGRVYTNERTKTTTYCAFNPTSTAQKVRVWKGDKNLGTFVAAPRSLTAVTKLGP